MLTFSFEFCSTFIWESLLEIQSKEQNNQIQISRSKNIHSSKENFLQTLLVRMHLEEVREDWIPVWRMRVFLCLSRAWMSDIPTGHAVVVQGPQTRAAMTSPKALKDWLILIASQNRSFSQEKTQPFVFLVNTCVQKSLWGLPWFKYNYSFMGKRFDWNEQWICSGYL